MFAALVSFVLAPVDDLLPDMIVWDQYLLGAYEGTTQTSEAPAGRRCIRFSTTTANLGTGPLELRGGAINGGLQAVNQRVYRSDGSFYDRLAGNFLYHPTHGHMHYDEWTHFRLREYLPGGGVGAVLRTGEKTSFCIIETTVYDSSLPGFNNSAWGPYSCGQLQGQKPGRADTYGSTLSGQFIAIDTLPNGTYWLEGEVDPNNNVIEKNETNNITRVLMSIGTVPAAQPDLYENNDTKAITDARTEGAVNSPNLGLINAHKMIPELSMDDTDDYYKFRIHGTGGAGDYVRIESPYHSGQNINLYLLDSTGATLASVTSTSAIKQISLLNRPAGTYYVRCQRNTGANPNYMLRIEPDGNLPPVINVTGPVAGEMLVEKNVGLVPVTWTSADPENDPKRVALFYDSVPIGRETNVALDGYQDLAGSDHEASINTALMPIGTWYIIGRAWDGGAYGYGASPGRVTIYHKGDWNMTGEVDNGDIKIASRALLYNNASARMKTFFDMDYDGDFDRTDLKLMISHTGHDH